MNITTSNMKTSILLLSTTLLFAGCSDKTDQADAFGNFEATEVMVSAETSGRILRFDASEGRLIDSGATIVLIDTTLPVLQKTELEAAIRSVRTRIGSINAQNDILDQQIKNLNVNIARVENMMKDEAATQKQFDDLTGQVAVLEKQKTANNTQRTSVLAEIASLESKKATLDEQISRCTIKSPISGTVIEKYSEAGEITAAGKPLVKIADLSLMKLRVYIDGASLGSVKTGQQCTVRIDDGRKGYSNFTGTVSWISGKAEFTPKIIQTREERVTLVYAVVIDVENDGTIKAGMPGEAIF